MNNFREAKSYLKRCRLSDYSDRRLLKRFRFSREKIEEISEIVRPSIERLTTHGGAIPLDTAVLASLRLLATGSYQLVAGDVSGISQATMSRLAKDFTQTLSDKASEFISFPYRNEEWLRQTANTFEAKFGIPGIVGAVDGFHVELKKPAVDGDIFLNRNRRATINCQILVGPNNEVLDIVTKWPGSTHDSVVFKNSALSMILKEWRHPEYHIIGDSAYELTTYLLTPFKNSRRLNRLKGKFNLAHSRARVVVEMVIGYIKMVFRILDKSGGGKLLYSPQAVARIVMACAVLHNIRIGHTIPEEFGNNANGLNQQLQNNAESASQKRARIAQGLP